MDIEARQNTTLFERNLKMALAGGRAKYQRNMGMGSQVGQ
jgi:hypothetical protein